MVPNIVCDNFADTIVLDCMCVPVCKMHSHRLRYHFAGNTCPICGRAMTGGTIAIKGGWEWVYRLKTY